MTDYVRVTFSMAAVRYGDYEELKQALDEVRARFCKGGSSLGLGGLAEGTVIRDV